MPKTPVGSVAIFKIASCLESIAFEARLRSLKPSPNTVSKVSVSKLILAIALDSCRETHTILSSSLTVIYSGSKSRAISAPLRILEPSGASVTVLKSI